MGWYIIEIDQSIVNQRWKFNYILLNWYKIKEKVLVTIVEGDPKAPFSIATTPRCKEGRYSFP